MNFITKIFEKSVLKEILGLKTTEFYEQFYMVNAGKWSGDDDVYERSYLFLDTSTDKHYRYDRVADDPAFLENCIFDSFVEEKDEVHVAEVRPVEITIFKYEL